jgi:micrococcal nuclease
MTRLGWVAAGAFLVLLWAACTPSSEAQSGSAYCTAVVDGDTLKVRYENGTQARVILYGVDCPELDQPSGTEARAFTNSLVYRKTVWVEARGKDSHGRTIALVRLPDGTNVAEMLVQKGLAWWSDKYAPKDEALKKAHETAKSAQVGLWAAPNPIPPWIWRNGQKNVGAKILPSK